jgi:hypothetical protein
VGDRPQRGAAAAHTGRTGCSTRQARPPLASRRRAGRVEGERGSRRRSSRAGAGEELLRPRPWFNGFVPYLRVGCLALSLEERAFVPVVVCRRACVRAGIYGIPSCCPCLSTVSLSTARPRSHLIYLISRPGSQSLVFALQYQIHRLERSRR